MCDGLLLVSRLSALENWSGATELADDLLSYAVVTAKASREVWVDGMLNQEETTQELQYGQLLTRKGLSCVN